MTNNNGNYVTIKGTKEGLTIVLNDQCSFHELLEELKKKIEREQRLFENGPQVEVRVDAGNRYLSKSHEEEITEVLNKTGSVRVHEVHSNVMTKDEAQEVIEKATVTSVTQIVRSGQVLRKTGDILIIGDVNPGGVVEATGNIYVIGALKGIARAGTEGESQAVVCASVMIPKQISISDTYFYAPEKHEKQEQKPAIEGPGYAYVTGEEYKAIAFEETKMLGHYLRSVSYT